MLMFEASRKPCLITPRPLLPGMPCWGWPEAADSLNRFCPIGSRPAGVMKLAIARIPRGWGWTLPGKVADPAPSALVLGLVELGAMGVAAAGDDGGRGALGAEADGDGVGGNGDAVSHGQTVRGDQPALGIDLERAIARVAQAAVGQHHLKKAVA